MEKTNMVRYSKVFATSLFGIILLFTAGTAITGLFPKDRLKEELQVKYQEMLTADVEASRKAQELAEVTKQAEQAKKDLEAAEAQKKAKFEEKEALLNPNSSEIPNSSDEVKR